MTKRRSQFVVLLLCAGLVATTVAIVRRGSQSTGDWAEPTAMPTPAFSGLSVDDARRRSEAEHRLLIVDATASWCPPCRQMEATTWRDPRVLDWIAEHAVAVQVDVDKLRDVARTLGIHAMPTIVVSRGADELDRATGLKSPGEFLAWLDRVSAGGESLPKRCLSGGVHYPEVPDKGSANAIVRLMIAKGDLANGRLDDALTEVEWLWAYGAEQQPAFNAMRCSLLADPMKRLVEQHGPARETFRRFLDVAQRDIDTDHVSLEAWCDWGFLCTLLGENSRMLDWYEKHRDADGSIDAGRYWECSWIADTLFPLLIEQKRFSDAGHLYRTPTLPLERQVGIIDMTSNLPVDGALGTVIRAATAVSGVRAKGEAKLRQSAAQISAALIAADREPEAIEVGHFLLARLDDGASRRALVAQALEWSRPLPEHARWYAEAVELGEDVESLEAPLEAALHR